MDASDIDCDSGFAAAGTGSTFARGEAGADNLTSGIVVGQPARKMKKQIHNANFIFNISMFLIADILKS
jgi:hypothetical protein